MDGAWKLLTSFTSVPKSAASRVRSSTGEDLGVVITSVWVDSSDRAQTTGVPFSLTWIRPNPGSEMNWTSTTLVGVTAGGGNCRDKAGLVVASAAFTAFS